MIEASDKPVSIFFETSVLLIFFILLGKYLESSARGKTTESLSKLVSLQPDTAIIISLPRDRSIDSEDASLLQNGVKKEVPISLVCLRSYPVGPNRRRCFYISWIKSSCRWYCRLWILLL
jgi:cation transport ATPase